MVTGVAATVSGSVANVLLRYAEQRYTHSRLYAGGRPEPVIDAAPATRAQGVTEQSTE